MWKKIYLADENSLWDQVIEQFNGHFMFQRRYMDYHSDRFEDASLIFKQDGRIVALLPANKKDDSLQSHGGLSFGGLLHDPTLGGAQVLHIMEALVEYARAQALRRITYKRMPWIYQSTPVEADAYALHRLGFKLTRRDLSSAIPLNFPTRLSKGRKHSLAKARKASLTVSPSTDFEGFYALLEGVLKERHQLNPVHTAAEIRMLSERFPNNIKLLGLINNGEWLAGAWLFITPQVCHTQYLAANIEGRSLGAMDLIVVSAIELGRSLGCNHLSFGISTENDGLVLNEGLLGFKEMFGATSLCHDHYVLDL